MEIRAHLFSTLYAEKRRTQPLRAPAVHFASALIRGTNRAGNFGRSTRRYRFLPKQILFPILQATRRDLILLESAGRFVASCAFQTHFGDQIHSFAYDVIPDFRGNGLTTQLVHCFLDLAHQRNMAIVRLHGDPDVPQDPQSRYDRQAIIEQFQRLRGRERELGISVLLNKGYLALEPNWKKPLFHAWA